MSKLIYTETDEAPALATKSLLPVIQRFAKPLGIQVIVNPKSPTYKYLKICFVGPIERHFCSREDFVPVP